MTHELFSWGSGAYGRLGVGDSEDVPYPQRIGGVCNGKSPTRRGLEAYATVRGSHILKELEAYAMVRKKRRDETYFIHALT